MKKRDFSYSFSVKLRVQSGTHQKWQNEPLGPRWDNPWWPCESIAPNPPRFWCPFALSQWRFQGRDPRTDLATKFLRSTAAPCPQMVAWRPIWWQILVRPGVPGESGPRQSGMFCTSGSVESLPNGDSPQELQTSSRDAASTESRASGSGFASTGLG